MTAGELAPGEETTDEERIAGRIMLRHAVGGVTFWTIRQAADQLQVMLTRDELGGTAYADALELDRALVRRPAGGPHPPRRAVRPGRAGRAADQVAAAAAGQVAWTVRLETRSRQRELDLTMNPDTHRRFRLRSTVLDTLRSAMTAPAIRRGGDPDPAGAAGRGDGAAVRHPPQRLDIDLYCAVASELYLKRLLVGGIDRVFDLGPMFRNEGVDTRHNPEFTMLESNQAFADYRDMIRLCQALFVETAGAVGPLAVRTRAGGSTGRRVAPGHPAAGGRRARRRA